MSKRKIVDPPRHHPGHLIKRGTVEVFTPAGSDLIRLRLHGSTDGCTHVTVEQNFRPGEALFVAELLTKHARRALTPEEHPDGK